MLTSCKCGRLSCSAYYARTDPLLSCTMTNGATAEDETARRERVLAFMQAKAEDELDDDTYEWESDDSKNSLSAPTRLSVSRRVLPAPRLATRSFSQTHPRPPRWHLLIRRFPCHSRHHDADRRPDHPHPPGGA